MRGALFFTDAKYRRDRAPVGMHVLSSPLLFYSSAPRWYTCALAPEKTDRLVTVQELVVCMSSAGARCSCLHVQCMDAFRVCINCCETQSRPRSQNARASFRNMDV